MPWFFLVVAITCITWIVGWGILAAYFCLWVGWIPKETTFPQILVSQLCLLPAYFLAGVLTPNIHSSTIIVYFLFNLLVISFGLYWVFRYLLEVKQGGALATTLVCVLLPTFMTQVFFPHVDTGSIRPRAAKAKANMRSLSEALDCYHIRRMELPLPVDQAGQPIAGIPASAEDPERLFFFAGPSFVPPLLLGVSDLEKIPEDPFALKKHGTYSYGMGTDRYGDALYMLSSPGPDKVDESEELEGLYLYVHQGNLEAFEKDPLVWELQYSPTNGTLSPGGLYQAGVAKKEGVW